MYIIRIKLYLFRTHFKTLTQTPQNTSPNSNLHLIKECAFALSASYITLFSLHIREYEFSSMKGRETSHLLFLSQGYAQDKKQRIVVPENSQWLPVLSFHL